MGFAVKDVRFTVRRADAGDPIIYPRLLRDRTLWPKIEVAIDYLESLVGKERQDLDGELFVNFFGDHKLARSVMAALGATYRFRPRRIDEVVSKVSARRLHRQGIAAPKLLRLALYDDVNAGRDGFVAPGQRDAAYSDLAGRFNVRPAEVERVLSLDLQEHAVLCRLGPRARSQDVAARFNVGVLGALLRQAERIDLQLDELTAEARATAARLAAVCGVAIESGETHTIRLPGRQDALGNWSRHGRRLARAVLELLERGQSTAREGQAVLALPNRRVRLRLTAELLAMLSTPDRGPADWHDDLAVREAILERVISEVHRRPGNWTLRRMPEPPTWSGGVLLPDLLLRQADHQVLLCAVRSAGHGHRLTRVAGAASAVPCHFLGEEEALAPLRAMGAPCLSSATFTLPSLETALSAA